MYNRLCVTDRSMPFWCIANPLSDPFGGPVQAKPDSLEVEDLPALVGIDASGRSLFADVRAASKAALDRLLSTPTKET